ncbi:MAG: YbaN family protein [Fimbriimonadales bacterium]|nr:YbaN family protein [Fimbriimonadales bacterium]
MERARTETTDARLAHRGIRWLFALMGVGCVGLGYLGLVVPGMPATVFFLVALWSFQRSCPAFERWLLEKSPARGVLQDWQRERSMSLRTKRVALAMLWVSIALSVAYLAATGRPAWVPSVVFASGLVGTWVILRVRTKAPA